MEPSFVLNVLLPIWCTKAPPTMCSRYTLGGFICSHCTTVVLPGETCRLWNREGSWGFSTPWAQVHVSCPHCSSSLHPPPTLLRVCPLSFPPLFLPSLTLCSSHWFSSSLLCVFVFFISPYELMTSILSCFFHGVTDGSNCILLTESSYDPRHTQLAMLWPKEYNFLLLNVKLPLRGQMTKCWS